MFMMTVIVLKDMTVIFYQKWSEAVADLAKDSEGVAKMDHAD